MEKIQFKCELLSDIVLNDSSATEGKRRSLDFIPGNNFLGIAAAQLYEKTDEAAWCIFHSGHVRFGMHIHQLTTKEDYVSQPLSSILN